MLYKVFSPLVKEINFSLDLLIELLSLGKSRNTTSSHQTIDSKTQHEIDSTKLNNPTFSGSHNFMFCQLLYIVATHILINNHT